MDERPAIELLLSPFRVLDITEEKGCYFCAKILGDLGAEVIRIEKPEAPRDFWWWAYNDRKKLVRLDIEKEPDRLLQLVREVDFLIESFPPGYLDRLGLGYATLRRLNPGLVMTSITPFGQTGPYKDLKASDLEILAMAGVLHGMGDPDRPPVRISLPQSYLLTSAEAAVGTLIALHWRELTGEGQQVDVSAQECVLGVLSGGIGKQEIVGIARERMGRFHGSLPGTKLGGGQVKYNHPQHPLLWPCKDGHVAFLMLPGTRGAYNNRALVKYMEMDGDLPDIVRNIKWESFDITQTRPEDLSEIWGAFARLFARHTHQEIYQIAQKERIELFPGNTVKDSLTEEQLEARRFWQEHKIPEFGKTFKLPGSFAQAHFPASGEVETMPEEKPEQPRLPFEGIKVLEFTLTYTG
ncbi:MAG: CoA transferase, partial [Chloroflexi bacterium]|nr:CoA transferase [Chloroflexota bacterium]